MRRGDLHRPRSLLRVGIIVGDNRDAPADQRQNGEFADQFLVTLVFRIDCDRGIAQHRFRARRRDGYVLVLSAFERVFKVP